MNTVYKVLARSADINKPTTYSPPSAPSELVVDVINNKLVIKWNEDNNTPIEKITFTQAGVAPIEYVLSNFYSTFEVPNKDFINFKLG
jgi:hypothetical protein